MDTRHSSFRKSTISPFLDGTENSKKIYMCVCVCVCSTSCYSVTQHKLYHQQTHVTPVWIQLCQIHIFLVLIWPPNKSILLELWNIPRIGSISLKDFTVTGNQSYSLCLWPVRKDMTNGDSIQQSKVRGSDDHLRKIHNSTSFMLQDRIQQRAKVWASFTLYSGLIWKGIKLKMEWLSFYFPLISKWHQKVKL